MCIASEPQWLKEDGVKACSSNYFSQFCLFCLLWALGVGGLLEVVLADECPVCGRRQSIEECQEAKNQNLTFFNTTKQATPSFQKATVQQ